MRHSADALPAPKRARLNACRASRLMRLCAAALGADADGVRQQSSFCCCCHGRETNRMPSSTWNSLEVAKLLVSAATPIAVSLFGLHLARVTKRLESVQWRNQRLVEKRIAVYDDLAPKLNDLLCYFTFVGGWKELAPPEIVAMKRSVDKQMYLAAPLFSEEFFEACNEFVNLCFEPFQGWGRDARLRTMMQRRKDAAGEAWKAEWDECFCANATPPEEIRRAYRRVMLVFSHEIGLGGASGPMPLGGYPTNIR